MTDTLSGPDLAAAGPDPIRSADDDCDDCDDPSPGAPSDQFVYALGRLEVKFPSLSIVREYQQRERLLVSRGDLASTEAGRLRAVLTENAHLARSVCYVLAIGGLPAYVVTPTAREVLAGIVDAVGSEGEDRRWDLVIGRRAGVAPPTVCGGVLAPLVACDQLYTFTTAELIATLVSQAGPAVKDKRTTERSLGNVGRELFERIAGSADNVGALDSHRALNYLAVQHPGLFVAAAERSGRSFLDSIETRISDQASLRRVVTVILSFVDRTTGVRERLSTAVDVTEEWPFLVSDTGSAPALLGLNSFIDDGSRGTRV